MASCTPSTSSRDHDRHPLQHSSSFADAAEGPQCQSKTKHTLSSSASSFICTGIATLDCFSRKPPCKFMPAHIMLEESAHLNSIEFLRLFFNVRKAAGSTSSLKCDELRCSQMLLQLTLLPSISYFHPSMGGCSYLHGAVHADGPL